MRRSAAALSGGKQTKGGVSSFAYQGTNSHATIGPLKLIQANLYHSQLNWERQRFWFQVHNPPLDVQDPFVQRYLLPCPPALGLSLEISTAFLWSKDSVKAGQQECGWSLCMRAGDKPSLAVDCAQVRQHDRGCVCSSPAKKACFGISSRPQHTGQSHLARRWHA